jgi:hypothetical protein
MNRDLLRTALWNLGLLILGILPLFLLLAWLQAVVQGAQGGREPSYMLETGAFYYITFVGPVALGGALHQLILALLPTTVARSTHRALAVVLTAVIPLVIVLLGQPADVVLWFAAPLSVSLLVYGLALRLPPREPATA